MLRKLGRLLFKGTPLERPLWKIYNGISIRWEMKSIKPSGWYTITPDLPNISSFELYTDGIGVAEQAKIRGEYELEVAQQLVSRIESGDVFWEVGSRYGYHTHIIAQISDKVLAFEADPKFASKIRQAARKNNCDNVEVVEGVVGEEVSLDEMPPPDIILMDIEGWEQKVIENTTRPLESQTTWIVEMHEQNITEGEFSNKEAVIERFRNFDYTTEIISQRRPGNYHLLAEPIDK